MNKMTIAVAALAFALPAHAVDVEIGAGFNNYQKQSDGVWYQRWLPHEIDDQSTVHTFGVSQEYRGIRYRVEYVNLGSMFINAVVTSDGTYNPDYITNCNNVCDRVALILRESTAGVALTASRPVTIYGLPFYAEAGAYVHQTKLAVNVSTLAGEPLAELARQPEILVRPVLGFGLRYSGVDVGVRYYYLDDSSEGDPMTPAAQSATTLTFKVYF